MGIRTAEIRRLEEITICDHGIPGLLLMENAGRSVTDVILRNFPRGKVLVVSGKGNNGGDGFVVARHLANHGYPVGVFFLGAPERLPVDSLVNYKIVRNMGLPMTLPTSQTVDEELQKQCRDAELVVDAILGIGVRGPVQGILETAIRTINASQRPVVSIDVPSGLDADTGEILGVAIQATRTVTLALPKTGLALREGPACAGKIDVADIGIPRELLIPFLKDPPA